MKREYLKRDRISSVTYLREKVQNYIYWFNYERISLNKDGLIPVLNRSQSVN